MEIKRLENALKNLDSAAEYLNEHIPQAAQDFMLEVHSLTTILKENPSMGRTGRVFGTRELVLQQFPYLIPYRVKNNYIEILRVFPTRMNLPDYW